MASSSLCKPAPSSSSRLFHPLLCPNFFSYSLSWDRVFLLVRAQIVARARTQCGRGGRKRRKRHVQFCSSIDYEPTLVAFPPSSPLSLSHSLFLAQSISRRVHLSPSPTLDIFFFTACLLSPLPPLPPSLVCNMSVCLLSFSIIEIFNILYAMQCSTSKSTGGPNTDRLDTDTNTDAHIGKKTRVDAMAF